MDHFPYNKPKTPWRRFWLKYRFSAIAYSAVALLIFIVYHFLSDGDFSFLMTLGSIFSALSFFLLVFKTYTTKSVSGISIKTLQAFGLVFAARLCSILVYEGYLPFDKSGDWFYKACEILGLVMVVGLLLATFIVYSRTYTHTDDSFGAKGLPASLGILWLVGPCLLLAVLYHPSLNGNWLTDTAWTFALYLEAVAILPQLVMFQRQRTRSPEVEPYTANFVFFLAVARLVHFIFWLSSFHELNDRYAQSHLQKYPGYLVVFSQLVNLALISDYVYVYLKSAKQGKPVLLV